MAWRRMSSAPMYTTHSKPKRAAQGVVYLVGAGVVQVLALEPDARTTGSRGEALGEVQRRGTAHEVLEMGLQLSLEGRVPARRLIGVTELLDRPHEGLRHEPAAVDAEMAADVRQVAQGFLERRLLKSLRHRSPRARRRPSWPHP